MSIRSNRQVTRLLIAVAGVVWISTPAKLFAEIEFNRDVRPILSDHCFACHGPDKNRREADLRLDTREGLLGKEGKPGTVVSGNVDASELFRRVAKAEGEEKMPPAHFGKDLSAEQIETLRQWIEQGADFEGHWAFQPIKRPVPPAVESQAGVVRNEVDQFIQASLKEHGIVAAPEADRRTLARRLSFDLTGLPPSCESVEAFVQDNRPDAYERYVDQLLESEHFGERMATYWLDLVRYADSVGYHGDQATSVSPFRDYVIKSFNENRPFDQFTIEQLAGDLLPNPTKEQQIAAGYNRLGMMSAEGGVQDKEYLAKYIAERVRNVSGTWMGVTMGCCECHDHKYDPFTAREFYGMEAFFADIEERGLYSGAHETGIWGPYIKVPNEEQEKQLAEFDRKIGEVQSQLDRSSPELEADQLQWESQQVKWETIWPTHAVSFGGAELHVQPDGSFLVKGSLPDVDTYELTYAELPTGWTGLRIEVLPDPSLPNQGPGRAGNGNFVLSELIVQQLLTPEETSPIALQNPTASYEQVGAAGGNPYGKWAVAAAIDGDSKGANWGWAIMEQAGKANEAVFEIATADIGGPGKSVKLTLKQNHGTMHTIGKFKVSFTTSPKPLKATGAGDASVLAALQVARDQRTEEQKVTIAKYYRSVAPRLDSVRSDLARLQAERKQLDDSIPTTLVTKTVAPRMVRVLARGNWMDDKGEVVEPGFPECLPQVEHTQRMNRLDLAKWLVSPQHPLTSRVLVNRLWKIYFGSGLSKKLDDLGSQGDWPTHPELLDWLAGRMIDSGWDIKAMIRLMVTSDAYRRVSSVSPEQYQADLTNRWLGRQNRFRLDAEFVRDNALAASGLLVRKVGGKSVKPYQPPGYWSYLNFPQREWENSSGESLYRRGLYTHWQRQYLHPSLVTFDAPSREECTADRPRSNTPLQSLVLLNDPIFVESARALAEQAVLNGGTDADARIQWIYRVALSRAARPDEATILKSVLEEHLQNYRSDAEAVKQILAVGAHAVPAGADPVEVAAWTGVTRAVMNLHEFLVRP